MTRSRSLLLGCIAAAAALSLAGCSGAQRMFAPGGPAGHRIASLGWAVLMTFSAVTVIMWVLVFWIGTRRRGSFLEHAPWDAKGDTRWILIGGFLIPTIILCVFFVMGLGAMSSFPLEGDGANGPPPTIRVAGHQWWWEVHYLAADPSQEAVTANEIHIPVGRPVDIELVSRDVIHSFWVPQLHGKVDLVPGYTNRIRIQADRAGVYRGECAEYCGPQHAKMILLVVADPPDQYEKWVAAQRAPAAPPAGEAALRGEQLFMSNQCVLCHTVRGTAAHGLVGPDLTHLASRKRIAANAYANDTANLAAWITHAQALKPDAQMPNITALDGTQLRAVVSYLQGLR